MVGAAVGFGDEVDGSRGAIAELGQVVSFQGCEGLIRTMPPEDGGGALITV